MSLSDLKKHIKIQQLYFPLAVFLFSRVLVFFIALFANFALPQSVYFPYQQNIPDVVAENNSLAGIFVGTMSQWDGNQYLNVATTGYSYDPSLRSNVAFFPLYPLIVRFFVVIFNVVPGYVAVIVSHVSFLLALYAFYFLCLHKWGMKVAKLAVLYLVAFPTSFFYSAVYSESIFLLLSVTTFLGLEKRWWVLAGVSGFFACLTRVVGIALFPVACLFLWDYFKESSLKEKISEKCAALFSVILIPLGMLSYMAFLKMTFGNALAFLQVQQNWESHNGNYMLSILDMLNPILKGKTDAFSMFMLTSLLGFFFFCFALILIFKYLNIKYVLYAVLLFALPLGFRANSLLRYCGIIFPMFIALAQLPRQTIVKESYMYIAVALQAVFLFLFANFLLFF